LVRMTPVTCPLIQLRFKAPSSQDNLASDGRLVQRDFRVAPVRSDSNSE
jgi:hypothetical protein